MGGSGLEVEAVKDCMLIHISDVEHETLSNGFGTFHVNHPFFDQDDAEIVWRAGGGR